MKLVLNRKSKKQNLTESYFFPRIKSSGHSPILSSRYSLANDLVFASKFIFQYSYSRILITSVFFLRIPQLVFNFYLDFKVFILKLLTAKQGRMNKPLGHSLVLLLNIMVLFLGGAGGNELLGRSIAKAEDFDSILALTGEDLAYTPLNPDQTEQPSEYVIKEGDTIYGIGEKFKISAETIQFANNIANVDSIKVGQTLLIPPVSGALVKVKDGDTIESLAKRFVVSPQLIVDFNYLSAPYELSAGQELVIPDARIPDPVRDNPVVAKSPNYSSISAPKPGESGSGEFVWPTNERSISQFFSGYHPALDITKESPIYAADGGTVVSAQSGGWNWGYGNNLEIDHGNGYVTHYAHLREIYVSAGDVVSRGETIGIMGTTGRSTGIHLHFEVKYNGRFLNPLDVL